jgi:hypothetical protein
MIELLNQLLNDMTPFYLYVSILLTMVSVYSFTAINTRDIMSKNYLHIRQYHDERFRLLPMQELFGMCQEVFQWFVKKANRLAAPEDDTDHLSFSFIYRDLLLRGGQQCKVILYSLFLRSTVSSR